MVRVHDIGLLLGWLFLFLSLSIRVLLTVLLLIIITTLVLTTVEWSISQLLKGEREGEMDGILDPRLGGYGILSPLTSLRSIYTVHVLQRSEPHNGWLTSLLGSMNCDLAYLVSMLSIMTCPHSSTSTRRLHSLR